MREFYAVTKTAEKNELNLFGSIGTGWFDESFDERQVAKMFKDIDASLSLDVIINSNGGAVSSAIAIKSMLERHPKAVTVYVSGLAASAATLITSATNAKCVMQKGSLMMVHDPRSYMFGPPAQIKKNLEALEKCAQSMRDVYCAKTGKSGEEIAKIMEDETWMTADEAVTLGFADEVNDSEPVTAALSADKQFLAIGGLSFNLKDLPINAKLEEYLSMSTKNKQTLEPAANTGDQGDPQGISPMTAQALASAYPQQVAELINAAVVKERERIKAISELDDGANHDIIVKAQFEEPLSPEACAMSILKAQRIKAASRKKNIIDDAKALAGDLGEVGGAESTLPESKDEKERKAAVEDVHAEMKQLLGY